MSSTRELALRLGVTERAVRHAIAEGRIPAQRQGTQWVIDLDAAEAAWHERERLAPAAPPEPAPLTNAYNGQSFDECRAVTEFWKAKRAELDYRGAAGALVERAEVQAAYDNEVATCRSKLLGVPSRYRQRVTMRPEDFRLLEELVREALEELGSSQP